VSEKKVYIYYLKWLAAPKNSLFVQKSLFSSVLLVIILFQTWVWRVWNLLIFTLF